MRGLIVGALVLALAPSFFAAKNDAAANRAPEAGKFPAPGAGKLLGGELISVDHVNRRGILRPDGDGSEGTYHDGPQHRFAMLPYGNVRRHGAPAELRDLPIGTHLHGLFLLPAVESKEKQPADRRERNAFPDREALLLEDDFSFHQRQGNVWKVQAVDLAKGNLTALLTTKTGPAANPTVFTLDRSTRVWKGRGAGELEDIAAGQDVQCNFTWAPDWQNGQMHVADIWIDEESRAVATERQRQIHIRHTLHRWLPGWVDRVEHNADGSGIVAVTLFAGADRSLYDKVREQSKNGGAALAAAEWTLRPWWPNHDSKYGSIVELHEDPNPPPGSSGLQIRVKIKELLEGYRPGRIVRVRPNGFPNSKPPPEERIKSLEDRDRSARITN
jgi:hypothetical protein